MVCYFSSFCEQSLKTSPLETLSCNWLRNSEYDCHAEQILLLAL